MLRVESVVLLVLGVVIVEERSRRARVPGPQSLNRRSLATHVKMTFEALGKAARGSEVAKLARRPGDPHLDLAVTYYPQRQPSVLVREPAAALSRTYNSSESIMTGRYR